MARPSPRRWLAQLRTLDPNVRTLGLRQHARRPQLGDRLPAVPDLRHHACSARPVALLGLIEGIAEATASITKYPFGQAADYTGRRRPFVLGGYTPRRPRQARHRPGSPAGGWPSPAASPTASARACGRRRATTSSRRTRSPASRAWRSACTAPWTRWARCSARSSRWRSWRPTSRCAGSSPSPSSRGCSASSPSSSS